jgi:hypothetical protein
MRGLIPKRAVIRLGVRGNWPVAGRENAMASICTSPSKRNRRGTQGLSVNKTAVTCPASEAVAHFMFLPSGSSTVCRPNLRTRSEVVAVVTRL